MLPGGGQRSELDSKRCVLVSRLIANWMAARVTKVSSARATFSCPWRGCSTDAAGVPLLLAQYGDLFPFDQLEIDFCAEAGFRGGVDEAVAVDGDVFGKTIFLHRVGQ